MNKKFLGGFKKLEMFKMLWGMHETQCIIIGFLSAVLLGLTVLICLFVC